jgi:integrase
MPKVAKALGALAVLRINGAGLHPVGTVPGLCLNVTPSGQGKSWILRTLVAGKRREIGLGSYPTVTLADAHRKAREARESVGAGVDPIEQRRAAQSALRAASVAALTFEQCAAKFIDAKAPEWKNAKHATQWTNTLTQHAFPTIGGLLVRDIGLPQVRAVLEPIWTTKTETASRLRGRIEAVLDWATVNEYRAGLNPARWRGHLDKVLSAPSKVSRVRHHPALPAAKAAAFMADLADAAGTGARALEFAILCAARSGEVRLMTRREVDRAEKVGRFRPTE